MHTAFLYLDGTRERWRGRRSAAAVGARGRGGPGAASDVGFGGVKDRADLYPVSGGGGGQRLGTVAAFGSGAR